ncbi:MAG: hypothetical protein Q9191_006693, partial [Dirinaria sp. TL-2023a]
MASPSIISNPFSLIIVQRLTIALLVAFTSDVSPLRPLTFPIIIAWNIHLLPRYYESIPRVPWVAFLAGENLSGVLNYAEKVLIRRWSFEVNHETTEDSSCSPKENHANGAVRGAKVNLDHGDSRSAKIWKRLRFGFYIAFSDRYIASSYQTSNTPPYSSSQPTYIPSRFRFLLRKCTIVTTCYLIMDLLALRRETSRYPIIFASSQIPFFSRLWYGALTADELAFRTVTTLGVWFGAYCAIQGFYSALSFLAVLLGISRPELERPVFGNVIRESSTLRGFWGRGWHQLLRGRLVAAADWLTYGVLWLPRPGETRSSEFARIVTKYTHLTCVFLVSGLLHSSIDSAKWMSWEEWGSLMFFVLMAVGIMIEDAVQWVWSEVVVPNIDANGTMKTKGKWWMTVIGHLWV